VISADDNPDCTVAGNVIEDCTGYEDEGSN